MKHFLKIMTAVISASIICMICISPVFATPTYNGTHISGTKGLCPYYGLQIYPDIYNEMNNAFVEVNGAAGYYCVALWPSLAHSKTSYTSDLGDGYNSIYTVAYTSETYLGQTQYSYNLNTHEMIEADINFNMIYPFGIDGSSSSYDLISVLTHELGHVSGMHHDTSDYNAVMYPSIPMGVIHRSFTNTERAYLYNLYH